LSGAEKLDYLFDSKEIKESQYKIEQVKVQTLAKAWLNSTPQLKQDVLKELKETLCEHQNERAYVREEYFMYDSHYIDLSIHEPDLNELI
jgi:nitrate reductase alpha subunit